MKGSAPDSVVTAVTADFNKIYPKVNVNVEIQNWSDVGTKLDTAFAGTTPPDVMELGNTLVAKYGSSGALADLTSDKGSYPNSSTWLQSLTDSCTVNGKLYCVPYYAGTRAVIYRTDMFTSAGITAPPTSLDELAADGAKLNAANSSDSQFSALYFPGKYWYAMLSYLWDNGGNIATQSGTTWTGALSTPASQAAITSWAAQVKTLSKADKTGDEAKQDAAFAQGHIAMIIANGWEIGVITDPASGGDPTLKPKLGVFPLPSHTAGQTAPVFLGGSDLGIAKKSKHSQWAADWTKLMTGTTYQTQMVTVGGVIPNTTSLVSVQTDPLLKEFGIAAKNSRFVPNSPNWANVETANVIPNMMVAILTGQSSVADATKSADTQIAQILNASS
jgi:N,N'-diacetylchitobiose transport system substrate-binding protein